MRLGFLGPAEGQSEELGRAAQFILDVAHVDRAVYLGDDDSLNATVASWASRLVGKDPSDEGTWARAIHVALSGTPAQIDRFVNSERARLRLRALESLPPRDGRTIEMIGDRVAVLIHDKAKLDEEDIMSASLLVYGKSAEPLVKKIGARWFVSPGILGCPSGGLAVLEDNDDTVVAEVFDANGKRTFLETLEMNRKATTRIQGA